MPGSDGVVVPDVLSRFFDAQILVDNDVNIMALGKYWSRYLEDEQVLFVKVATGIGCGIITGGAVESRQRQDKFRGVRRFVPWVVGAFGAPIHSLSRIVNATFEKA
jgi:hypothetical protein